MFVWKDKNKRKRGREWPILNKKTHEEGSRRERGERETKMDRQDRPKKTREHMSEKNVRKINLPLLAT